MCISPIRIRHPTTGEFIDVNCNKCLECVQKNVNSWAFRLLNEMKDKNAYFFTLTYDDYNLPKKFANVLDADGNIIAYDETILLPGFRKEDVQKLIHSIRDELRRNKLKNKLKYFIASEYGKETLRPHYHGIIFGFPFDIKMFEQILTKYWDKGFVSVSPCNETRVYYTLKYVFKDKIVPPVGLHPSQDRPFMLCSKNLGINFLTESMTNYIMSLVDEEGKISVHQNGFLRTIPKYYRDKIFNTPELKEKLKRNIWDAFDEYLNCPDSQDKFRWRDENYKNKLRKVKNKLNKEKM